MILILDASFGTARGWATNVVIKLERYNTEMNLVWVHTHRKTILNEFQFEMNSYIEIKNDTNF